MPEGPTEFPDIEFNFDPETKIQPEVVECDVCGKEVEKVNINRHKAQAHRPKRGRPKGSKNKTSAEKIQDMKREQSLGDLLSLPQGVVVPDNIDALEAQVKDMMERIIELYITIQVLKKSR